MKFDPMRPIWLQVMGEIETGIVTGQYKPGDKLPGGRIEGVLPGAPAGSQAMHEPAGVEGGDVGCPAGGDHQRRDAPDQALGRWNVDLGTFHDGTPMK